MKCKKLFIRGKSRTGKSRLIKSLIEPYLDHVGGYFCQRIYIGPLYRGFALKSFESAEGYVLDRCVKRLSEVENIFLFSDEYGKWHMKPEIFNDIGVDLIKKSVDDRKKLIVLDEIGGIELGCSSFMKEIVNLFNSNVPVIGVIKSDKNKASLKNQINSEEALALNGYLDADRACIDNDIKILDIKAKNRSRVESELQAYIKKCI